MAERNVSLLLCAVLICLFGHWDAFGLGTEEFGDKPIHPQPDWPEGVEAVIQSPGRIYSRWVNGDEHFYYRGDTAGFNEVLRKFADTKTPIHRLILQKEYGKVKSLDGKSGFRYDWLLRVPSGLYRNQLIREKGKSTNEIYPSIVIPSGSNISFEGIIVPSGVDVIYPGNVKDDDYVKGIIPQLKNAQAWSKARIKWLEFVEPYLEKVRRKHKDPSINYVEVRSVLISKYLPDYKIYIIETNVISFSKLFAVSIIGEILDLKSGSFGSVDPNGPFRNEAFSEFFKEQQIKIADPNTAIEISKLIEEITFAPSRWGYLKLNTNNFSIFKMWVFYNPGTYWLRDWEYYAKKEKNYWIVSRRYIGPPACITAPPRWKLVVDGEERIIEVMH